jgi:hypothetical protein
LYEVEYIRTSEDVARISRRRERIRAAVGLGVLALLLVGVYGLGKWFSVKPSEFAVTDTTGVDTSMVIGIPNAPLSAADSLVADGSRLSDQGVYDRALMLLDSAVRMDSTNAVAFASRGDTRLRVGDVPAATNDFARVVRLSPRLPYGYLGLSEAQLAAGDSMDAILTLRTGYALVEPYDRDTLGTRLRDLGSRPVDRSIEVRGYTGSRSDAVWLRRITTELDRSGYPLAQPWVPARNNTAEVRYFRDSRLAAADTVRAVVQRSLDAQNIPVRIALVKADSLRFSVPPGSITIWLPPMEPARRPAARPPR